MSRRRRGAARRRKRPQSDRWLVHVYTEGKVTEPEYLEEIGRRYRATIRIEIAERHGVPKTLVDHACKEMDSYKRSRASGDAPDQIWCVFDRDSHQQIRLSINRARQKGVYIAFSNPCFELWLVLHRQDQNAYIDRRAVKKLAQRHRLVVNKSIDNRAIPDLIRLYENAKKRAIWLDRMHQRNLTQVPDNNPSTGVWRLVDSIRQGSPAGRRGGSDSTS